MNNIYNNGSASADGNMSSNTYNFIPADMVEVLAEGAPLPSPEVLGGKSAAYCVYSSELKPIASDPTPMALRYLGTWAEGAAGLRAENLDLNDTDTADRYELYVRVEQAGTQYFAVEADDSARLVIPGLGVDITKPVSSLNIARGEGVAAQAGFYRIAQLSYSNIQYGSANAVALKVSHDTQAIPDGDYSGYNTFSRSFSSAPNIKLYVLLKGAVPQKVATSASSCECACSCKAEGQGKAELGCARWSMVFGQFPMMAGMPSAQLGLFSTSLAAADLTPAVLRVDHPMMRTLTVAGDTATVQPPFGDPVQYSIESGNPLDVSASSSARVRVVDSVYLEEVFADGSSLLYPLEGGSPVRITTSEDVSFTAAEFAAVFEVLRDENGQIAQVYSASTGLLHVQTFGASAFMIYLYPLSQVGAKGESGFYTASGTPLKSVGISGVAGSELDVIEQPAEGTETRHRWLKNGDIWSLAEGTDAFSVSQGQVNTPMSPTMWKESRSFTDSEGNVISAEEQQWRFAPFGQVLDKSVVGAGDEAQETSYLYGEIAGRNDYGRLRYIQLPNGGHIRYEYDAQGRVTLSAEPTAVAGFAEKGTRTSYSSARFYDNRPTIVKEVFIREDGTELLLSTVTHAYTDTEDVHRVTTTRTAAGTTLSPVSIEERFGSSAELVYARGRLKMQQEENGVQTHHAYQTTTEYGACVLHTRETRSAEGALVPGQSERYSEYIAVDGTVTRREHHALSADSTWLLLSTESYTYDALHRELSCTRGNGRTRTKTWMCCGLLSETDEDGVTTLYNYDAAKRLIGTERSATPTTPSIVTAYQLDTAGRRIGTLTTTGELVTSTATAYDSLGRTVSQTDVLGRTSTTSYSADGLTTTETTPAGATLITTRHSDGSVLREHGTGQRETLTSYALQDDALVTEIALSDGTVLSRSLVNGLELPIRSDEASSTGFVRSHRAYNDKGQLIRSYADAGDDATAMAPTLIEYNDMGQESRQVLALADEPSEMNSPVTELSYGLESADDGVYRVTTQTRYNASGNPLTSTVKRLVSELSATLADKTVSIDERGNTSSEWSEYSAPCRVTRLAVSPASSITAQTVIVDGFTVSEQDFAGIVTTHARSFTSTGVCTENTDGRGNVSTVQTDKAGRVISETDAADHTTSTEYAPGLDAPALVTDAMGHTSCYRYDIRGRKVAEWGTALQPACFGYDEAGRMTSLTTFRAGTETVSTDPSERTDGDTTTWAYHAATGSELRKTYADGSSTVKTYDAFNRLSTETSARGLVATYAYEPARGLLTGISYSDETPGIAYSYNHLGMLIQVTDAAGTRSLGYNTYGEAETDSLVAGEKTHLITELRDSLGRSVGYTYAKDGAVQQTVGTSYGTDGRITGAGFLHGGEIKK
ncbi:MAG: hypothetical protein PUD60_00920 [Akkermansia muciniphila]|nr:hypothetical protein [Akkermansia muciniphila]